MNELPTFGNWLRERRKELDLTQFDLGERVGCSEDTIQKIERGERRPSKQIAQRLAEVLHIPTGEQGAFVAAAREGSSPGLFESQNAALSGLQISPAGASITNLPTPLTPLIGREDALAEARSYLLDGFACSLLLARRASARPASVCTLLLSCFPILKVECSWLSLPPSPTRTWWLPL
jgi:transcriptional regulator with XRE-family HTH domain